MSRLKRLLDRARFAFWRFRDGVRHLLLGKEHRRRVFSRIYAENLWAEPESRSGTGSSLAQTARLRDELPRLLARLGVRTVLDAPCGDFAWMRQIVAGIDRYYGVDIVPELVAANAARYTTDRVTFAVADIAADPLPAADLVLCRDCFIHLPTASIRAALRNFRATGARFLLLTNDATAGEYHDIPVGSYRPINFERPPFNFPAPESRLAEDETGNRQLCLWNLQALPV